LKSAKNSAIFKYLYLKFANEMLLGHIITFAKL
jgi:hypothetical protein